MTTPLYKGTGGHNYIEDEDVENPTNAYCIKCKLETNPRMVCKCPERQTDGSWKELNHPNQNHIEEKEKEFNRLCTVSVESGGFRRLNGTMDSFKQALWLRTTLTTYGNQRAEEGFKEGYEAGKKDIFKMNGVQPLSTPPNTTEND